MQEFLKECKVTRVKGPVVAGAANVTDASIIDMQGYDRVAFLASFGTLSAGAVTGVKVQHGDVSDLSDAADVEGTALAIAETADDKDLLIEIIKPLKRYLRLLITRATGNAVVNGAWAFQHGADKAPVTQDTSISASETTYSPVSGTA